MTKRIKLFLVGVMACLLAVSAIFLVLNTNTANATRQTLTGSKAQAEVTAEVDLSSFALTDSASIRTQSPKGIRFQTTVAKAQVANLPDNAVFGTLMLPTELLDGELTITTENVANAKAHVYSENGNNYEYLTALVGSKTDDTFEDFSSDFYTKEITARSYVTYTYGEGTTVTKYSNAVSWSVGQTAGNLLAKKGDELQSEQITFLKGIVDAVKVDMYTVEQTPVILTQNIVGGAFDVDLPFDANSVIGVYGENYVDYAVVDSDTIKITLGNAAVTGNVSFTVITEKVAYNLTVDINVLESMKATLTGNYIAQFDSEHYEDMFSEPNSSYYWEGGFKAEYLEEFKGEKGVVKVTTKANGVNSTGMLKIALPKSHEGVYTVRAYFETTESVALNYIFGTMNGGNAEFDKVLTTANYLDTWHDFTITSSHSLDNITFATANTKGADVVIYFSFVYAGTTVEMVQDELLAGLKENELANYDSKSYESMAVKSAPSGYTVKYLESYAGETGVLKVTFSTGNGNIILNLLKAHSGSYSVKYLVDSTATQVGANKMDGNWADGTAHLYTANTWQTKVVNDPDAADKNVIRFGAWNSDGTTTITIYIAHVVDVAATKSLVTKTLDNGEIADFDSDAYLNLLTNPNNNRPRYFSAEVLESVTLGGETRENVLKLTINLNGSANWSFVSFCLPVAHSGTYTIEFFMNQEDYPAAGQAGIGDGKTLTIHDWQKFGAWTKKSFTAKADQVTDIIAFGMVNHTLGATYTIYVDAIYDGTVA